MWRLNIVGMPLMSSNADITVSAISSLRLRFKSRLILLISIFLTSFFHPHGRVAVRSVVFAPVTLYLMCGFGNS